jgi:hypothetical protein
MNLKSPHALARCSDAAASRLSVRRRVGRFTAGAVDEAVFQSFLKLVHSCALAALTAPTRILTMRHLSNAAAYRMDDLEDSARVLIDGVLAELIGRGLLTRLFTVLPDSTPFHMIYAPQDSDLVSDAIRRLVAELSSSTEYLKEDHALSLLPAEITEYPNNVRPLLGSVVAAGRAYWDRTQTGIRGPRAASLPK